MEEDDKIQSHLSTETGSSPSPPSKRRIAVTVAAAPPPPQSIALALPIQQPRAGGREDCWSESATSVLIDAWGERYLELSRGNLKQKHWQEVADIVNSQEDHGMIPKTDVQCKNRIDTVKKKYKVEKSKIAAGGGPSSWPFFDRLDQLIGHTVKIGSSLNPAPERPVGIRSNRIQNQKQKQKWRRRDQTDSDSEPDPPSPDSSDSLPPRERYKMARMQRVLKPKVSNSPSPVREVVVQRREGGKRGRNWVRKLARAILKLGEAYERAESSKLQQIMEMEKQRMKFAKELDLQRVQFLMKTQLELKQRSSRSRSNRNNNRHHHHHRTNTTTAAATS